MKEDTPADHVLKLALIKLSEAFDEFIDECIEPNGQPKAPGMGKIMKARGYLPPYCKNSYQKKG